MSTALVVTSSPVDSSALRCVGSTDWRISRTVATRTERLDAKIRHSIVEIQKNSAACREQVAEFCVAMAHLPVGVSGCGLAFAARATFAILTTRTTCGAIFVTLGLFGEHLVRKTEFTGLLIDFEELHLDLVALLDAGVFHRFEAFPRDFGDVQETFFRRHELNEATVGHDAHYLGVVDFAHLGDGHDGADLCWEPKPESCPRRLLRRS